MQTARIELIGELKDALAQLPRVRFARLPTPLERCPRLSRALNGPDLWMKRDDLTGLTLSGNKTRMFEFLLGAARQQGVEAIVAGAAVQSNYCRQLAAACAKVGMECHLVLRRVRGEEDDRVQGGLLLDLLCGAEVEITAAADWPALARAVCAKAQALRARGKKVEIAGGVNGCNLGLHVCGYVEAAIEMVEQAGDLGLKMDEVWVCSSDMTQAGLALAFKHMQVPVRLVGVPALPDPILPGRSFPECIAHAANQCAETLRLKTRMEPDEIVSLPGYVGPGYGLVAEAAREAILLAGRTEAILLDPVYTAKAMAALIDHARRRMIAPGRTVVFVHTGGFPALFAYAGSLGLGTSSTIM